MALQLFLETADLAYVLEAMPVISVAWRDAVYARVGGPHAYLALLSPSAAALSHRITADDHVMALAERMFRAIGQRDFTIGDRRFVLLVDGDEDFSGEACLCIDRRRSLHSPIEIPFMVQHFVCEHGREVPDVNLEARCLIVECPAWTSVSLLAATHIGCRAFPLLQTSDVCLAPSRGCNRILRLRA